MHALLLQCAVPDREQDDSEEGVHAAGRRPRPDRMLSAPKRLGLVRRSISIFIVHLQYGNILVAVVFLSTEKSDRLPALNTGRFICTCCRRSREWRRRSGATVSLLKYCFSSVVCLFNGLRMAVRGSLRVWYVAYHVAQKARREARRQWLRERRENRLKEQRRDQIMVSLSPSLSLCYLLFVMWADHCGTHGGDDRLGLVRSDAVGGGTTPVAARRRRTPARRSDRRGTSSFFTFLSYFFIFF